MDTYRFFWIASSDYIKEARQSARSLLKHHPDADLTLFTNVNESVDKGEFSRVNYIDKQNTKYWFLESTNIFCSVLWHYVHGERVVYLDTDTHVCAPLDGLFDMLKRFDFVAAHAPGRRTAPTVVPITDAFPEYNIGVNGFVVSEELRRFFGNWLDTYIAGQDTYGNNDQAPLRETIWNYSGPLKFGTMPIEYNFRFGMGGQVRERVRVLHGRSNDYEALARKVNPEGRTIRAWRNGELK